MKQLFVVSFLLFLVSWCAAQCGGPSPCGGGRVPPYYQPYQQPYQPTIGQYQQPQPQQQQQQTIQYYYPANSYALSPLQAQPALTSNSVDKEPISTLIPTKSTYDEFEKELEKLKPAATIIKTTEDGGDGNEVKASLAVLNSSSSTSSSSSSSSSGAAVPIGQSVTYIREFGEGAYLGEARPLPYRPVPFISRACTVLPTQYQYQYLRPVPYYPRGYLQQVVQPTPTQPQPIAVAPLQQPATYVTAPPQPLPTIIRPPSPILPPPINDCCGKCGAPCKYRSRKNVIALASKIFTAQFVPRREGDVEDEPKDPKCNSEQLKDIMTRYITRTVALSKRLIQKNAEKELGSFFSVFCSTDDFSYVARSETFCQLQKNDIICYAFKHQ